MTSGGPGPTVRVDLPTDCEEIAVEVPIPATHVNGKPQPLRLVLRRTQVAAYMANNRLAQVKGCMQSQRRAYEAAR